MQKSGAIYSFWRKIILRRRKDFDGENITVEADELLAQLKDAESRIRDLVKHNAELTKTFAQELQNLAADFERRSVDERNVMTQKFGDLEKAIEKKLHSIQMDMDQGTNKLIDLSAKQNDLLKQEQTIVGEKLDRACGAVANVDGSITGIRNHLADQNAIQRRYQEGYDFQILKNFVRQIIQMINSFDQKLELTEEGEVRRRMESSRQNLIDLLDRSGVEQFVPVIGASLCDLEHTPVDVVGSVDAPTPSFVDTIAEVVHPGYLYAFTNDAERTRCIQSAKVIVFQAGFYEGTRKPDPYPPEDSAEEFEFEPATEPSVQQ